MSEGLDWYHQRITATMEHPSLAAWETLALDMFDALAQAAALDVDALRTALFVVLGLRPTTMTDEERARLVAEKYLAILAGEADR